VNGGGWEQERSGIARQPVCTRFRLSGVIAGSVEFAVRARSRLVQCFPPAPIVALLLAVHGSVGAQDLLPLSHAVSGALGTLFAAHLRRQLPHVRALYGASATMPRVKARRRSQILLPERRLVAIVAAAWTAREARGPRQAQTAPRYRSDRT
jgi:hypothetical protein